MELINLFTPLVRLGRMVALSNLCVCFFYIYRREDRTASYCNLFREKVTLLLVS